MPFTNNQEFKSGRDTDLLDRWDPALAAAALFVGGRTEEVIVNELDQLLAEYDEGDIVVLLTEGYIACVEKGETSLDLYYRGGKTVFLDLFNGYLQEAVDGSIQDALLNIETAISFIHDVKESGKVVRLSQFYREKLSELIGLHRHSSVNWELGDEAGQVSICLLPEGYFYISCLSDGGRHFAYLASANGEQVGGNVAFDEAPTLSQLIVSLVLGGERITPQDNSRLKCQRSTLRRHKSQPSDTYQAGKRYFQEIISRMAGDNFLLAFLKNEHIVLQRRGHDGLMLTSVDPNNPGEYLYHSLCGELLIRSRSERISGIAPDQLEELYRKIFSAEIIVPGAVWIKEQLPGLVGATFVQLEPGTPRYGLRVTEVEDLWFVQSIEGVTTVNPGWCGFAALFDANGRVADESKLFQPPTRRPKLAQIYCYMTSFLSALKKSEKT